MVVQNWLDVLVGSLQGLWLNVVAFLPLLIGALVVFVIGLIVAAVLERITERVVYFFKVDSLLRRAGVESYLERANLKLNSGHFLGQLVYWFIVIAFLLAASDILRFTALASFLQKVLLYIPNVLAAVLILLAALLLANFLKHLTLVSVKAAKMHYAKNLGIAAWWTIMVFGLLAALSQLQVATSLINTLITGIIAMLALAGGLAFGLGGKEMATDFLRKLKEE